MRRRRIIALVALVVAVPLAAGTGSFSSVSVDRGVDVAVAEDSNAYLGIDDDPVEAYVGGESFTLLELTDRAAGDLHLESVSPHGDRVAIVEEPTDIDESAAVRAQCREGVEGVAVTIEAASPHTRIVVDRTVPVECNQPEIETVDFNGCESADLRTAEGTLYPLSVTVEKRIYNPENDSTTTHTAEVDDGTVSSPRGKLIAVNVDGWVQNGKQCAQIKGENADNGTESSE
jgi:hypothetical protein